MATNSRAGAAQSPAHKVSQISGLGKDTFIKRAVQDIDGLEPELAVQVAEHLSDVIKTVMADREVIERYKTAPFNPDAFSLIKVYRMSGEAGLAKKLGEIAEGPHLAAIAKAQQISVPRALLTDTANARALREAIVKGVKARIADREAAS